MSCKSSYCFKIDNNYYQECQFYYYFDIDNKYYCTQDSRCPDNYNKLIKDIKKCVSNCSNDNKYKYEYNNTCYEKC